MNKIIFYCLLFTTMMLACHSSKKMVDDEPAPVVSSEVVVDESPKPEDPSNPQSKTVDLSLECMDKTAATPSRICDNENIPVCGCNKVNYKNPCEAEKVGVKKYSYGKCTQLKVGSK